MESKKVTTTKEEVQEVFAAAYARIMSALEGVVGRTLADAHGAIVDGESFPTCDSTVVIYPRTKEETDSLKPHLDAIDKEFGTIRGKPVESNSSSSEKSTKSDKSDGEINDIMKEVISEIFKEIKKTK